MIRYDVVINDPWVIKKLRSILGLNDNIRITKVLLNADSGVIKALEELAKIIGGGKCSIAEPYVLDAESGEVILYVGMGEIGIRDATFSSARTHATCTICWRDSIWKPIFKRVVKALQEQLPYILLEWEHACSKYVNSLIWGAIIWGSKTIEPPEWLQKFFQKFKKVQISTTVPPMMTLFKLAIAAAYIADEISHRHCDMNRAKMLRLALYHDSIDILIGRDLCTPTLRTIRAGYMARRLYKRMIDAIGIEKIIEVEREVEKKCENIHRDIERIKEKILGSIASPSFDILNINTVKASIRETSISSISRETKEARKIPLRKLLEIQYPISNIGEMVGVLKKLGFEVRP